MEKKEIAFTHLHEVLRSHLNEQMRKFDKVRAEAAKHSHLTDDFINVAEETWYFLREYLEYPNLLDFKLLNNAFLYYFKIMNAIKDLLDESIAQQVKDLEELYHAALNYNNCSCASSNNPIKENNG